MIDPKLLPQRAMLDTSVVVDAFSTDSSDEIALARSLFKAMVSGGRRVVIAAPTLAELSRKDGLPRRTGVIIVPFDDEVAVWCGQAFSKKETSGKGKTASCLKFDQMIIACAFVHQLTLVTSDETQKRWATERGVDVKAPEDYQNPQRPLALVPSEG